MDANPNEGTRVPLYRNPLSSNPIFLHPVLTLLIVNSDNLPASLYQAAFQSAGLDEISYTPPSASIPASGWPALGDMLSNNQRLVTFLDNGADFTVAPYLMDGDSLPSHSLTSAHVIPCSLGAEFTNVWETAFDVTDPAFDCNVNRTNGTPASQLYLINHFLDQIVLGQAAPDVDLANVTNAARSGALLPFHVHPWRSLRVITADSAHYRPRSIRA
jgi:hypothetical protein